MKKLLSIIAAVGLTATASSTVVACGTTKEDEKTFNNLDLKYQDQVVMTINGVDITLRDILGDKKKAYDADVMAVLNENVAKEYTQDYYGKQFSSYMNLANTGKDESEKQVDDLFTSSATLDLFVKYLESIHSGTPLDKTETYLNPIIYDGNNLKRDKDNLESEYSVWFKADDAPTRDGATTYKRWTVKNEVSGIDAAQDVVETIPSVDQLSSGSDFILVNNLYKNDAPNTLSDDTDDNSTDILSDINGDYSLKTLYGTDGSSGPEAISIAPEAIVKSDLTGQEALGLRMQQNIYKNNSQNMSDVMVMQYLKSKAYTAKKGAIDADIDKLSNESDKGLYLNLSSSFAKGVQTWKASSDTEDDIKSNYKMVWKFTVDGTDENRTKFNKAINSVAELDANPDNYSRFSRNQKLENVAQIFNGNTSEDTFSSSSSKEIKDPFFGINGFQGIVKDGQSVSGGVLNIKDEKAKNEIANVEGLGIISSGTDNNNSYSRTYNFESDDSSKDDYIVVMPLYLADLLRTNKSENEKPQETKENASVEENALKDIATGEWVEVNPQGFGWGWDSKSNITIKDEKANEDKTFELKKDGEKTFMKFAKGNYGQAITLSINGEEVTVTSESEPNTDDTTYGYEGIYSKSPENVTKENAKLLANNGKRVKYKIHLGVDSTVPDNYEKSWVDDSSAGKGTPIDEVANLKASQKEDIINTLLFQVAKSDTNAQESAKYELYPKYIDLENIYYKATKDELSKYIKKDDDKIDEEDW